MAAKPKLYYFRGRGRMESIRWLLAAAGVEVGSLVRKGRRVIWVRLKWQSSSLFKIHDGSFKLHPLFRFPLSSCVRGEGQITVLHLRRSARVEA